MGNSNKNLTWQQVYQLPLHVDKYSVYAWSENGTMSLMFFCDEDSKYEIVKTINGELSTIKPLFKDLHIKNAVEFYDGNTHLFTVRGWGT